MTRLRSLLSLVLLAALQGGAAIALLRFGQVARWHVDWSHLGRWIDATPPTDVAVGLGRWVALVLVLWQLGMMALYLLACLTRVPALVRATGALTLPALRRAVEGTVAVGLSASVILGAHAAGAAPVSGWADRSGTVSASGIPTAGVVPGPSGIAPAVAPSPTAPGSWEVVRGDNLWDMACGVVSHEMGVAEVDLADYQIEPYWHALMDANPAPSGDPNLIYPQWQVVLPPFDPAIHAPGLAVVRHDSPNLAPSPPIASPAPQDATIPPVPLDVPAPPTTVVASSPDSVVTFSEPANSPATTVAAPAKAAPTTTIVARGSGLSGVESQGSNDVPSPESTVVEHPVAPQSADPTPTVAPPAPARRQQSSAPFLGMGILAAGLGLALNEARRFVARRRKVGEVPEAPTPEEAEVEVAIRENADASQAEFVTAALRALASVTDDQVAPLGVTVDDDEVRVFLAPPLPGDPPMPSAPEPFEETMFGPEAWTLPRTTPMAELVEMAGAAPFLMPALVGLGKTADGATVFVDLEEAGLTSVTGDQAVEVVSAALMGLATAPWSDRANVIAAGFGSVPALGVRSVVDPLACIDELEAEARRVGEALKDARCESTFEARCRGTADDAWTPTVLVCAAPPDLDTTRRLVDLVSKDTAGVAVIVAGAIDGALWTLRCDDGRMEVDALGLTVTELQQVSQPIAARTVSLLEKAQALSVRSVEPDEAPAPMVQPPASKDLGSRTRPRPQIVVRVLGPVCIDGAEMPKTYSHRTKALEALAALVLHPDVPVDSPTLFRWLWPHDDDVENRSRLTNTLNQLRDFLRTTFGIAPDGAEHFPGLRGAEKFYLINRDSIGCDFLMLRQALADARYEDEATAKALLREALEWVVGSEMFAHSGKGYEWTVRDFLVVDAERMVTDAAVKLARLYLDDPDVIDATEALWATQVGLRVIPGHEELVKIAMEAQHHLGNPAGVEAAWRQVVDDEPSEDVVEAHQRYGGRLVSVG